MTISRKASLIADYELRIYANDPNRQEKGGAARADIGICSCDSRLIDRNRQPSLALVDLR